MDMQHHCGLYYFDTNEEIVISPSDDRMVVRDTYKLGMSFVTAVAKNMNNFTHRQVKRVQTVHRAYGMVGTPLPKDFNNMVRGNGIKNFPVTHEDCVVADAIWGRDVHSLKDKSTRMQAKSVTTDFVAIPQEVLDLHMDVTLTADVVFTKKLA